MSLLVVLTVTLGSDSIVKLPALVSMLRLLTGRDLTVSFASSVPPVLELIGEEGMDGVVPL